MSTEKTSSTPQAKSVQAAGSLDPTFGVNGVVTFPLPLTGTVVIAGVASHLISEADPRIYACTYADDQTNIVRLLQNGEIDTSFGNAGYLLLDSGDPGLNRSDLLIERFIPLDSEKIIGWGTIWITPFEVFEIPAAVCFTADGVLDTSFGNGGIAIFKQFVPEAPPRDNLNKSEGSSKRAQVPNSTEPESGRVVGSSGPIRLADGKLLLLGSTYHRLSSYHIASYLMRINADGSLDSAFGQGGVLLIKDPDDSTKLPECQNFDIDRRGGIVVTGTHFGTRKPVLISRYDSEGHVDRSFGKNGVVHIGSPYGFTSHARGVLTLDDGKVILLLSFFVAEVIIQHAAVIQLLPNGDPDLGFNNGEPVLIDLTPEGYCLCSTINLDAGNRIIIGGDMVTDSGSTIGGCISRMLPNGTLDTGFGSNGTAVYERFYFLRGKTIQNRVNILAVATDRESDPIMKCIARISG